MWKGDQAEWRFWGAQKVRPPFDFAQGRLCGPDVDSYHVGRFAFGCTPAYRQ
jgi:hypothetical protein